MYYSSKAVKFLNIAIIAVLVIGVIGGIFCAASFKVPTAAAIKASKDIIAHPTIADDHPEWYAAAEKTRISFTGIMMMLGVWVCAAISAALIYAKRVKLEMTDVIIRKIEILTSKIVASE